MSAFKSAWLDWEPTKTPTQRTDKADRRAFVSSVSAPSGRIQPEKVETENQEGSQKTLTWRTDKADRSPPPASSHLPTDSGNEPKSPSTNHAWDAETTALIKWFLSTPPPSEPFELSPGVTIAHPIKYWAYLRQDIAAGAGRGRSYYGTFEANLRRLYQLFGPGDIVPGGQTEELVL